MANNPDVSRLSCVFATMLKRQGDISVYQFNKFIYLFEFHFIRNFAQRYIKEQFIKLPHGPVITDYKKRIIDFANEGLVITDTQNLAKKRVLEDDVIYERLSIYPGPAICSRTTHNPILLQFVEQLLSKYGDMSFQELEKAVYSTIPVVKYEKAVEQGYRKKTGGYILKSDLMRITETSCSDSIIKLNMLLHFDKNPEISEETQTILHNEFEWMRKLRPSHEHL